MLGGAIKRPAAATPVIVRHTAEVVCGNNGVVPKPKERFSGEELTFVASADHPIKVINLTTGARTQIISGTIDGNSAITMKNPKMLGDEVEVPTVKGDHLRLFWEEEVTDDASKTTAVEVTISPDTFPGTYRVVGDTFMRSEKTGKDEPFQFVINKAKVLSEVTITLEAEGDPSTFEMQLNVLRDNSGGDQEMMKLVRYSVSSSTSGEKEYDRGSIGTSGSNSNSGGGG